ncbi:MAG: protein translocase subunit SecD [Actinomycetota bacterium]
MVDRSKYVGFLILSLVIVVVSAYLIYPVDKSIKLGLDLQGGASVQLEAKGSAKAPVTTASMDQAENIIRQRVDKLGVAEPGIIREGQTFIQVQLPGIKDPDKALAIIGKTALLEFREVLETEPIGGSKLKVTKNPTSDKESVIVDKDKKEKYRVGPTLMTGSALASAATGFDQFNKAEINITFSAEGGKLFDEVAVKTYQKQLAIVLDDSVQSAPVIQSKTYNGRAVISGNFTTEEANTLALVLQTGALPVKLEMSDVQTVGATLGRDSLRAGLTALIIGFLLVIVYFLIYYRGLGILATLALTAFALVVFGVAAFFGTYGNSIGLYWNMTLPGLAGIILSVGVAADSSIVILERIKEEVADGKTFRVANEGGFKHGFLTMVDANFVTFITAFVLYVLAVGPVRGFAFTLMLGVVIDLFITFFFLQPMLGYVLNYKPLQKSWFTSMKGAS